ncbi:MAG: carbon storage regulator CsrA [Candidatus Marinimicrobia bacterium]|nr:carbon storage regulator CsrA [Candidatus Neomarinimicrobiota bacterium]MCF7880539.1 carbon storage regulator CsrA [Candidatus Neomarinimicrobiota bacterium]
MLVLTRQKEESIIIGQDIVVKVLEVQGDSVKLGIEAPRSVPIVRSELYEEIKEENLAAMQSLPDSMKGIAEALRNKNQSQQDLDSKED